MKKTAFFDRNFRFFSRFLHQGGLANCDVAITYCFPSLFEERQPVEGVRFGCCSIVVAQKYSSHPKIQSNHRPKIQLPSKNQRQK